MNDEAYTFDYLQDSFVSWSKIVKLIDKFSEHETNCKSILYESNVLSSLLNFKHTKNVHLILTIIRATFSIEGVKYQFSPLKILSTYEILIPVELFLSYHLSMPTLFVI